MTANTRLKFNPMRQIRFDLSSVAPQATPGHIAKAPSRNSESLVCHPIVNACGAADATQVGPALTASPQAQERRAFTAVQEQLRTYLHGGCARRPGKRTDHG